MVIAQFNLYTKIWFYKFAHNSGPKGSPDMILSAFHVKFYAWKTEIPPRACKPPNKIPKVHKKQQSKCTRKWVPRAPVRPSGRSGGRSPLGRKKAGA